MKELNGRRPRLARCRSGAFGDGVVENGPWPGGLAAGLEASRAPWWWRDRGRVAAEPRRVRGAPGEGREQDVRGDEHGDDEGGLRAVSKEGEDRRERGGFHGEKVGTWVRGKLTAAAGRRQCGGARLGRLRSALAAQARRRGRRRKNARLRVGRSRGLASGRGCKAWRGRGAWPRSWRRRRRGSEEGRRVLAANKAMVQAERARGRACHEESRPARCGGCSGTAHHDAGRRCRHGDRARCC